jgi:uncharacterized membrane protein (DUF106 family)
VSNTQLYFAIGIPCFTIITSLIVSLVSFWGVRDSMKEIREDMRNIREEIREIRTDFRDMRASFAEDIRSIRSTLELIIGKLADLDTRVSVIEDRLLGGAR